ncbi:uncharacterized protein BCR38DRAFT_400405 [Pseudomassariella vexata]|uniref:CFEM domain-containing protein n=1 Tax=Pseudomassariella vexata TaxID=1141098 RepID=A0A1Y2DFH6_9PEZI|nr:uncharacterized protein BCR38DRAFT_400405 [Pseudomassariella vexata]ORY58021.1 hypothetical protein BCR38DRAFT_400405 [Pseudomassariella vexata]
MRDFRLTIVVLACILLICEAAESMNYANEMPKCGITCMVRLIPSSTCALTNTTCLCTDTGLAKVMQTCILSECILEDALSVARMSETACGRPRRYKRGGVWAFIAASIVSLLCIILRMYSRWKMMKRYEADDFVLVVALPSYQVMAAFLALGVDVWTLGSDTFTTALKIQYFDEFFYIINLALTKLVLLFFFLRVFPHRRFRIAVYIIMGFVATSTTILLLLQIFQCLPIESVWLGWKGNYGEHRCLDINLITFSIAALSIAQEAVILVLPLPLLAGLNISRGKKVGTLLLFSLGIFVLVTSCIRLKFIHGWAHSTNPTWDYMDAFIWSGLEVDVSVIVVCIPAIRILVVATWPKMSHWVIASNPSELEMFNRGQEKD